MNFYNQYRPRLFQSVVGQTQATELLRKQVSQNDVSHSLLFFGPSGTGKTTTARILAASLCCEHPVNGEPCNECNSCRLAAAGNHWDIQEINCANLRGIDDMRQLCYKAYLSPFGPAKIFILDECHMLTKEAANCLLKLLEEPPPTLTLILCTTEIEQLPQTLISRCQKFAFTKLDSECIKEKLSRICQAIGVTPDPKHLDFIAQSSAGNLRSAENILQQVCALASK